MKSPILSCAIIAALSLGALNAVYADSAAWNANPVDNDWSNPANWTPATVPNGPNDVATFGVSSTTDVSITASIEVNSIVFSPGASAFTITLPASVLTISGAGITNDSGITQNFVTFGFISFTGSAAAGGGTLLTCNGEIDFNDTASAGDATVVSNGGIVFFRDELTAANATIIANGSDQFGFVSMGSASAGNATLIANGGTNGGFIEIDGNGPNTARVELYDNGTLYIGYGGQDAMVGSIEGDGEIIIGIGQNLSVGNNNLSTVFSGVIRDDPNPPNLESPSVAGQIQPKAGGALTKIGAGTLTLVGASRYTGATTVTAGVLKVGNKTRSATGRRAVNVNAGTLGGTGTVAGIVTVGTGSGAGAFLEPSIGAIKPSSLSIQGALTLKADSTYTYKVNTNRAKADKVIANGVTIDSGAQLNFVAIANKALTPGKVFAAISNTSATPISGTFANLPDGSTFTVGRNTLQANYEGGDGNDLTLTVVP
ncbi:MAG: hypothetical protein DMG96_22505 [Acidobacteria bacterium]|nr:MAG: hypothetical protein DMG96_22505 [Acidobacteriota bacterium]